MNGETRKCPYCNEEMSSGVGICPHCGRLLDEKALGSEGEDDSVKDDSVKDVISLKDRFHIALLAVLFLAVNVLSFVIRHGAPVKIGHLIGTGFIALGVGFAFSLIERKSPTPRRIKIILIFAAFFSAIVLLMRVLPK